MKLMRSLAGTTLAATVLALASAAEAQPVILRVAGSVSSPPYLKAMDIFKAEAARLSGGSIEVEVVPDPKKGTKELIDTVHTGNMFATWASMAFVSRLVPEVDAMTLPFFFKDYDQALRVVNGPVGKLIEAKLGAKGFTVLAWMEVGARHVVNAKRPLKTLDDFKSLKIRVQPNETQLATFRALGANPVAMDIKDVFTALRQGDIDGHENPYSTIQFFGAAESLKYLSDTGHFLEFVVFIANKKTLMSLDPEQQKAAREAGAIAGVQQRKMQAAADVAALAELRASGMQFDPLPTETRAALRRATAGVIDDVRKRVGADLVDKVLVAGKAGSGKNANR